MDIVPPAWPPAALRARFSGARPELHYSAVYRHAGLPQRTGICDCDAPVAPGATACDECRADLQLIRELQMPPEARFNRWWALGSGPRFGLARDYDVSVFGMKASDDAAPPWSLTIEDHLLDLRLILVTHAATRLWGEIRGFPALDTQQFSIRGYAGFDDLSSKAAAPFEHLIRRGMATMLKVTARGGRLGGDAWRPDLQRLAARVRLLRRNTRPSSVTRKALARGFYVHESTFDRGLEAVGIDFRDIRRGAWPPDDFGVP